MMQLDGPTWNHSDTLDKCIEGVKGNQGLLQKLTSEKPLLLEAGEQYADKAGKGHLYTLAAIDVGPKDDPVVVGSLTKSELLKTYDQYFVPDDKPAREIYSALLNAAKEKCPFCGGIGTPRNLDHFLPKKHFPQFSVLPLNLVPACRDCNMDGKATAYATTPEGQVIHPYVDSEVFFRDQWIFATYHSGGAGDPGDFEYFVDPPAEWGGVNIQRARKHFADFNLARRYATKAGELLGTVLGQIDSLRNLGQDVETIDHVILQPGVAAAPFVNHWQTGMFQALSMSLRH